MARQKSASSNDTRKQLITTTFECVENKPWSLVTMTDIAASAGVSLTDCLREFPNKSSVLSGLSRDVDAAVLKGFEDDGDDSESRKDQLFDVLMSRIDALAPYKSGLAKIVPEILSDPLESVRQAIRLHCSMALMLEAVGITSSGWRGVVKIKGLSLIYANGLRVWFGDDSTDMSATMAAIDRGLTKAEQLVKICDSCDVPKSSGPTA